MHALHVLLDLLLFFHYFFPVTFYLLLFFPATFFPTIVGFISLAAKPHNVLHTQHASRISTTGSNDTGMSLFCTVLNHVHMVWWCFNFLHVLV